MLNTDQSNQFTDVMRLVNAHVPAPQITPSETREALARTTRQQDLMKDEKDGNNNQEGDEEKAPPQGALSSRDVQLLVQHLQPQLDTSLFPPVLLEREEDSRDTDLLPVPPPAPAHVPASVPIPAPVSRAEGLDAQLQLARSKDLRSAGQLVAAVEGFKHTVTLIRKRERAQRNAADAGAVTGTGAAAGASLSEAYFLMGRCLEGEWREGGAGDAAYYFYSPHIPVHSFIHLLCMYTYIFTYILSALGKPPRAEACYILACKCSGSPSSSSFSAPVPLSLAEQDYASLAKHRLLLIATQRRKAGRSEGGGGGGTGAAVSASGDVEDLLAKHSLLPLHPAGGGLLKTQTQTQTPSDGQQLQFSCTMCGECCRSADNLLLSPHDIYEMTRW